jgi:dynein heavy chain
LISSIGNEKERWITTKAKLGEAKKSLLGDMILASAIVTYLGPFDMKFRTKAVQEMWMDTFRQFQVDYTLNFSLKEVVANTGQKSENPTETGVFEEDVTDWLIKGLPNEQACVENMIIMEECRSTHYPVLVDPQG